MFKFNFFEEPLEKDIQNCSYEKEFTSDNNCREIIDDIRSDCHVFKSLFIGNTKFYIKDLEKIGESKSKQFLTSFKDCDVIPALYEGGLKIWECTYDLLLFLMNNKITFEGKTVLDLGCGCGLLGIFTAMKGAKEVHFQDFNADVLINFTIPNVQHNQIKSKIKFISGDWKQFESCSVVKNVLYDYILSSEILYNASNYYKLYELFNCKLNMSTAEILVASKSYYFGVGGSVQQFQEYLNKTGKFYCATVWKTSKGVQREILSIKFAN